MVIEVKSLGLQGKWKHAWYHRKALEEALMQLTVSYNSVLHDKRYRISK